MNYDFTETRYVWGKKYCLTIMNDGSYVLSCKYGAVFISEKEKDAIFEELTKEGFIKEQNTLFGGKEFIGKANSKLNYYCNKLFRRNFYARKTY